MTMNINVLYAVFRRNFVSYFANPTGYVFICLFVLLGAIAAFWVPEFFSNNLANLDQLSYWLPFIMLVYIPTITMGIWADERKQGTDELLLTIPAGDFDIVLGKYLAAVAIFSVSLLFSLACNLAVLEWLGNPDVGLFLGTYIGYWFVGLAMLAIGMVASFLTSNITIGFVFGVLLNVPLVFLAWSDAIFGTFGREGVLAVKSWSIGQQLADFSRGVLDLAGVVYFLMIIVVMLYLSMVLIGRRHWFTGKNRWAMVGHYVVRTLAMAVVAFGAVIVVRHHNLRADISSEQLSSLSPQTRELIGNLKVDRPVQIDAYISPTVPESYVQTRLDLLAALREIEALGSDNIQVHIHNTDRFSKEAALAEKRYGIEPRQVTTFDRGAISVDHIFLNVAVRCGMRKVAPVFIDRGVPVEYELVRSICTVSEQKRKKVGVLDTDAQLYGSFNMQSMSAGPDWPIIDELEKQYEVVRVSPAKPITEKFDVLLAVQPSSLGPDEMNNFIAAIESGQPTAIFEDPAPVFGAGVPATSAPRQAPGGMNPMMMQQRRSPPKGDIRKLWNLLGVDFSAEEIVWQDYNPYPKAGHFPTEFVFIDEGCDAEEPFNQKDSISSRLQQLLFPFPGSVAKLNTSDLDFTPLAKTGEETGTVLFRDLMRMTPFGPRGGLNPDRRKIPTGMSYVLASHIQGQVPIPSPPADDAEPENGKKDEPPKPKEATIDVVLVADIDMLSRDFFRLREQGDVPEAGIHFNFDNVTFVLNVLDELAGDSRFIDIRKRRPVHRTLTKIEERTKEAKQEATDERERFIEEFETAEKEEQKVIEDKIAELRQRKNLDIQQMAIEVNMMQQNLELRKKAKIEQLRRKKDQETNKIETRLALEVRSVQDQYKLWAVLLPPILPLMLALIVFFTRRSREREGVSRSRLR